MRSAVGTLPRRQIPSGAARPAAHSPGGTNRIARRNTKRHCRRAGRSAAHCKRRSPTSSESSPIESPRTPARLLEQLPGVGIINLAQLLAEIGPILDRVDTAEQAATECGAAPVTKASGKTTGVYFRSAANKRARKAITAFAHNSRCSHAGQPRSTPMPGPEANATPTRSASSPAPGPHHLGMLAFRRPGRPNRPSSPSTDRGMNNLTQGTQTQRTHRQAAGPSPLPTHPAGPLRRGAVHQGLRASSHPVWPS